MALELAVTNELTPTIDWLGATTWTATQLLARGSRSLACDRAMQMLEEMLRDGPRTANDLWDAARQQHIGIKTVEQAKSLLNISSSLLYHDGRRHWWWFLPHQGPPGAADDPYSLEPWLKPMRDKYDPQCPLDDDA
jgi:hypothetical protein